MPSTRSGLSYMYDSANPRPAPIQSNTKRTGARSRPGQDTSPALRSVTAKQIEAKREALRVLSQEQLNALTTRNCEWFYTELDDGSEDGEEEGGGIDATFHDFARLPMELMLRVMSHMKCPDLLGFLNISKVARQLFLTHPQTIFVSIQQCQFPAFAGIFGDMPGFIYNSDAEPPARTDEQQKNMDNARIMLKHYYERSLDQGFPIRWYINSIEKGGWYFLSFLAKLQRHVRREAEAILELMHNRTSAKGEELDIEMNIGLAQAVAVCHGRMTWGSRQTKADEDFTRRNGIKDPSFEVKHALAILETQEPDIRTLFLSLVKVIISDSIQQLDFKHTCTGWLLDYRSHRPWPSNGWLSDEQAREFASTILVGLIFQEIVIDEIATALEMCSSDTGGHSSHELTKLTCTFEQILQNRLYDDERGLSRELNPRVQRGILWARGLGYDVENLLMV